MSTELYNYFLSLIPLLLLDADEEEEEEEDEEEEDVDEADLIFLLLPFDAGFITSAGSLSLTTCVFWTDCWDLWLSLSGGELECATASDILTDDPFIPFAPSDIGNGGFLKERSEPISLSGPGTKLLNRALSKVVIPSSAIFQASRSSAWPRM